MGKLLMERDMEKVCCCMIIAEFIKECGKMILSTDKGFRNFLISVYFREIISMANLKVLADTAGQTDNFIKDNG